MSKYSKNELDIFSNKILEDYDSKNPSIIFKDKIKSMEWLYLAAKGHRRARFDLEINKDTWLIP